MKHSRKNNQKRSGLQLHPEQSADKPERLFQVTLCRKSGEFCSLPIAAESEHQASLRAYALASSLEVEWRPGWSEIDLHSIRELKVTLKRTNGGRDND